VELFAQEWTNLGHEKDCDFRVLVIFPETGVLPSRT